MPNNQKTDQLELDRDVSAVLFEEMQKVCKILLFLKKYKNKFSNKIYIFRLKRLRDHVCV